MSTARYSSRLVSLLPLIALQLAAPSLAQTAPSATPRGTTRPAATQPAASSRPTTQSASIDESLRERAEKILDRWEASHAAAPFPPMSFSATRIDGDGVVFPTDYRNKLVVVIFWATWCPVCKREIEHWRRAYDQFHARDVAFLGICTDKNRNRREAAVRTELDTLKLPWPQIYEEGQALSEQYNIASIPSVFIIDGDSGAVLAHGVVTRKTVLGPCIERLLKRRAATRPELSPPQTPPSTESSSTSAPAKP